MFSGYLDNLQIRYKLLLLLIFPVAVLMLFTSYGIAQKWHEHGEAQVTQGLYKVALGFSDVIHALQRERGLSAGYLGSEGNKFYAELALQRAETDRHIQDALSFDMEIMLFNDKYDHLKNSLSGLAGSLERRYTLRNSVDAGEAEAVFERYSEIIADVINLVENIGVITEDAVLARNDQAYGILLWLQEFTGRERGLVNGLLSSGKVHSEPVSLVIINIAEQDSLLKRFRDVIATTRQKAHLENLLTAPSRVYMQEIRRTLFYKVKKLDALDRLQVIAGYGGLIHQFKNYVIRGDERYKTGFIQLYAKAQENLDYFRSIPNISEAERVDINLIETTFQKYYRFLPTVEQMRKEGAAIKQIDRAVKVDDTPAINAITRLRKGIPEIAPGDWFDAATKSINLLKADSDAIRQESLLYIQQKTDETLVALASYVLLAIIVLLFSLYLGVIITRRLAVGAMEITQALQRVEDSGDFSGYIQVDGNDEIAAMGRSFNSLIKGGMRLRVSCILHSGFLTAPLTVS